MNQRKAFDETVELAFQLGMPELPGESFGFEHLVEMQSRITEDFSDAKLGRWLGWAQCALVMAEVGASLEDVKSINLSNA